MRIKPIIEGSFIYAFCFTAVMLINLNTIIEKISLKLDHCDSSLIIEPANIIYFSVLNISLILIISGILSFILKCIGKKLNIQHLFLFAVVILFLLNVIAVGKFEGSFIHACPWLLGKVVLGSILSLLVSFLWVGRKIYA